MIHDRVTYNYFGYCACFSPLVKFEPSANSPPKYPNIGYLGSCYDIFKGNPLTTRGLDPGFLDHGIYLFTYNQGLTTADGRYSIPDHTTVNDAQSCSFSFSSRVNKDTASYMDSLKIHVDASFKGWAASFSASADYQEVHQSTQSRQTVYVSSQAQCQAYGASIDYATFTDDFVNAIRYLPEVLNSSTKHDYLTFIQQYGTHIVTALKMGGRFGVRSEFATSNYSGLYSHNINVKATAGYSGSVDVSASLATDAQKKDAKIFNDVRRNYKMFQIGGHPPVDEKQTAFEWAQSVKDNPLPLSYSLTELSNFVTSLYFPHTMKINEKQKNLRNVMLEYCMTHALDTSLCQKDFGPKKSDSIAVIFTRDRAPIFDAKPDVFYIPFQRDPKYRVLGPDIDAGIGRMGILVNSHKAPSNLITSPLRVINPGNLIVRYQCPEGYWTLTDNVLNGQLYQAETHMCVADHCLTSCTRVKTDYDDLYLIGNGFPELGNSAWWQHGGFFRDLSINDRVTPYDKLFMCLTYKCLNFY